MGPRDGISALMRRDIREFIVSAGVRTKRRLCEYTVGWRPSSSPETSPQNEACLAGPLILDFQTARTKRNKFLLSHLWHFVMTNAEFSVDHNRPNWPEVTKFCFHHSLVFPTMVAKWPQARTAHPRGVFFFFLSIYLFYFGCAGSSLLRGFSLLAERGGHSLVVVKGLLTEAAPAAVEPGF